MPKYKMLPVERSASSNGPDLYIIVAQEDFYAFDGTFIPCGTEGGFIESASNLPNRKGDKSWIFAPNGYVVGNATIDDSVVRFGYVSGNSKVTKSIIDKKSAVMENAHVINSTIFDSVIGVSSRLENCTLDGGCCINLYDHGSILDTDAKDAFKKVVLEEVQRGCTVVVVSHDHTFVEQEVDGLFHMENGVLTAKAVPM